VVLQVFDAGEVLSNAAGFMESLATQVLVVFASALGAPESATFFSDAKVCANAARRPLSHIDRRTALRLSVRP
jgi:hypothetical protein